MANHPENPEQTRERLTAALQSVLEGSEEFHIEDAPDGSQGFMQCVPGKPGRLHVEYSDFSADGERQLFRSVDDVPVDAALKLFASYANKQADYKAQIQWKDCTSEVLKRPNRFKAFLGAIGLIAVVVFLLADLVLSWPFWIGVGVLCLICYPFSRMYKHKFFRMPWQD